MNTNDQGRKGDALMPVAEQLFKVSRQLASAQARIAELEKIKPKWNFHDTHEYRDELEKDFKEQAQELTAAHQEIDTLQFQLNDKQNSLGNYKEMVQKNLARIKELEAELRAHDEYRKEGPTKVLSLLMERADLECENVNFKEREEKLVAALDLIEAGKFENGEHMDREHMRCLACNIVAAHRGEG